MNIALETTNVTKTYQVGSNTITAVDNASLQIKQGEFIALVGPSGSGKTTMLAMLAGLLSPCEGDIMIGGKNMSKMDEKKRTQFRREQIGFTFQANNLVPYLTVKENVELMLKLNGTFNKKTQKEVVDLLTKLGLGDRLNNLPAQLSGGQQQRVAIARSLIHNPKLVLADEPTASLDTERAYQVVQTFADLIHEQNLAGVMVTHDLRMCKYVDKIIEMEDGQVKKIINNKTEVDSFAQVH